MAPTTSPNILPTKKNHKAYSKRSADICNTCRARKVRCDGIRDCCGTCTRLGLTCSFLADARADTGQTLSSASAPGDVDFAEQIPSLRAHRACVACKSRKVRCSADAPACNRCRQRGIECIYTTSGRRRSRSPPGSLPPPPPGPVPASSPSEARSRTYEPSQTEPPVDSVSGIDAVVAAAAAMSDGYDHFGRGLGHGPATLSGPNPATTPMSLEPTEVIIDPGLSNPGVNSLLPDNQTMMLVFDKFFQQVHPIPTFSFFHKGSLFHQSRTCERDEGLLLAIVGITSLLTDLGDGSRDLGSRCAAAAERMIMAHYDEAPTLGKVQTLVIIVAYRMLTERFDAAFTLMSIAARFAYALRLNYESPKLPFLLQESRRRLMWSVFLLDVSLASGLPDFSLCPAESIHLQLPCRETDFELSVSYTTEPLQPLTAATSEKTTHLGLVALFVRLTWIRARILRYTKLAALTSDSVDVIQITNQVLALGKELDDFALSLPRGFELTLHQLRLQAYSTRVVPYLLLHIWWRQCYCDLYRIGLAGLQEALPRPAIEQLEHSFVETCQQQCVEKASGMVDVFRLVLSSGSRPQFLDINLPVCAYQCARVLFYSFRNYAARFGITAQGVGEQARVCAEMVEFFPGLRTDFLRIQADLKRLINQGCFGSPSPSRPSSPVPTAVFSRHSFLKKVGMSPAESGEQHGVQQQQPQQNTPDSMPAIAAPAFLPSSSTAISGSQFVPGQPTAAAGFEATTTQQHLPPDMRGLVDSLGQNAQPGNYDNAPFDAGGYYLYAPPMNPLAWVLDEWAGRDPASDRSYMQYEFLPDDPGG